MGKSLLATLSIIALCILCFTGIVSAKPGFTNFNGQGPVVPATKPGFTITDGQGSVVTVNGRVDSGEWGDSDQANLYSGSTMTANTFRVKWAGIGSTWYDQWLIEIFSDTTNDPGDFIQICYDSNLDGAATPQTDDYLINYTGHSTVNVFKGTGSGWTPTSDLDVVVASTISASPNSATPHWIIEINIENVWESTGDRVAAYDASNPSAGVLTWPSNSGANVPGDYGLAEITYETVPEGLGIGVMVLVSSVAMIVGVRYFRKPKA